jgi:hypothetical protein
MKPLKYAKRDAFAYILLAVYVAAVIVSDKVVALL